MKRGLWISLSLLCLVLVACGSSSEEQTPNPLTAKILNSGPYPMTAFYVQPSGTMPETGWEELDWGENKLPVARLENLQFVLTEDLDRLEYDAVAAFDSGAGTEFLRGYVHCGWIADGPFITIQAGLAADSSSIGYQWGEENWEGEVDVTP